MPGQAVGPSAPWVTRVPGEYSDGHSGSRSVQSFLWSVITTVAILEVRYGLKECRGT